MGQKMQPQKDALLASPKDVCSPRPYTVHKNAPLGIALPVARAASQLFDDAKGRESQRDTCRKGTPLLAKSALPLKGQLRSKLLGTTEKWTLHCLLCEWEQETIQSGWATRDIACTGRAGKSQPYMPPNPCGDS